MRGKPAWVGVKIRRERSGYRDQQAVRLGKFGHARDLRRRRISVADSKSG
jgi:hypothetical protein